MDQFADLLKQGAEVVGVQTARLWPQVVGITFVRSVFFSLVAVVLIIVAGLLVKYPITWARDDLNDPRSDGGIAFLSIGLGALLAAVVVVSAISLGDNLPGVFFPEAKAVLDIVGRVKK